MRITAEQLRAATGCTPDRAGLYLQHIQAAADAYAIDTPARMAAWLAQVGHESGSLQYLRELADGSAYEGRRDLGNVVDGDGERFRGRGLIQITGRSNYREASKRMQSVGAPDFVAAPALLEDPRWAAMSAGDYWQHHGCNELADAGDFEGITRRINGGLNGQADRLRRWELAKQAFGAEANAPTPQPAAQIDAGAAIAPAAIPAQPPAPETAASAPPAPAPGILTRITSMLPIIPAVLPAIVQAIPALTRLFGGGGEVSERNAKAAETVVGIVQEATGAVNAQQAAEAVAADPDLRAKAAAAVQDRWYEIAEAGSGGHEAARKADAAAVDAGHRPWQSPSMWAVVVLSPLAYMVVGSVVGLWGVSDWSSDVRASIASAVISLTIGGIAGYYWGASTQRSAPRQ